MPRDDRRAEFLRFPWSVWRFLQWQSLTAPAGSEAESTVGTPGDPERHVIDREDPIVLAPGTRVERDGDTLVFSSTLGRVTIAGPAVAWAARLVEVVDGRRPVWEVRRILGPTPASYWPVLTQLAGTIVRVSPELVERLERALPGAEISRFPRSPYAIQRNYWRNQIHVRELISSGLTAAVASGAAFVEFLRELHLAAIVGEDLATFYRPESEIANVRLEPGALYEERPRIWAPEPERARFLDTLSALHGDGSGAGPERFAVVPGWAGLCYFPPRPLTDGHFDALAEPLRAALAGTDPATTLEALARFHARFVRLHPFACVNQSLAMNLVNHLLRRSHAGYLPHLLLDYCAMALSEPSYARLLATAVREHLVPLAGAGDVYAAFRGKHERMERFNQRLAALPDVAAAVALVRAEPDEARLALLAPH